MPIQFGRILSIILTILGTWDCAIAFPPIVLSPSDSGTFIKRYEETALGLPSGTIPTREPDDFAALLAQMAAKSGRTVDEAPLSLFLRGLRRKDVSLQFRLSESAIKERFRNIYRALELPSGLKRPQQLIELFRLLQGNPMPADLIAPLFQFWRNLSPGELARLRRRIGYVQSDSIQPAIAQSGKMEDRLNHKVQEHFSSLPDRRMDTQLLIAMLAFLNIPVDARKYQDSQELHPPQPGRQAMFLSGGAFLDAPRKKWKRPRVVEPSDTQWLILDRLARGEDYHEIAEALNLSRSAVDQRMAGLAHRMGLQYKNSTAMGIAIYQRKMAPDPSALVMAQIGRAVSKLSKHQLTILLDAVKRIRDHQPCHDLFDVVHGQPSSDVRGIQRRLDEELGPDVLGYRPRAWLIISLLAHYSVEIDVDLTEQFGAPRPAWPDSVKREMITGVNYLELLLARPNFLLTDLESADLNAFARGSTMIEIARKRGRSSGTLNSQFRQLRSKMGFRENEDFSFRRYIYRMGFAPTPPFELMRELNDILAGLPIEHQDWLDILEAGFPTGIPTAQAVYITPKMFRRGIVWLSKELRRLNRATVPEYRIDLPLAALLRSRYDFLRAEAPLPSAKLFSPVPAPESLRNPLTTSA